MFFILIKARAGYALIHDPLRGKAEEITQEQLDEIWDSHLILIASPRDVFTGKSQFGFNWFIPVVFKYRRILGEVLAESIFLQVFALATPLFSQIVIDKVLVHKTLSTLDVLVFGLIVISLFEIVLNGVRLYVFSHTTNRIDVELGIKTFDHLIHLPLAYFQARRVGDSVARIRELENIRSFLTGNSVTVFVDSLFTVLFLAVMLIYSAYLTGIVVLSMALYILLSIFVTPVLRVRLDDKFLCNADSQAFLVEAVTGIETIKSMAVEPGMRRRWEEKLATYVTASFKVSNLSNWASQAAGLIDKLSNAVLLWIGTRLVIVGDLSLGEMIAFNMLVGRVTQPILRLSQLWQDFQQVRISLERIADIVDTRPDHPPGEGTHGTFTLAGEIAFERVGFRYRPDLPVALKQLSLKTMPGEVIGVVGPSGSGKSTLAKLVQRLYVAEEGRILLDGHDIATVDPSVLRRQIGVVPQDSVLFTGTVRENIALANASMPLEKVIEVARLAGAHEFIAAMPLGYDTVLGERGAGLSGGQRQRIAIARALAIEPRILILDEATSALDAESERIVQDNLQAICAGRTVIVIAHRLSTVRMADRIVALDQGEIVEVGTHAELIARQGRYASLWHEQMRPVK